MSTSEPTFEEARDELSAIVSELEKGGGTLEASMELWKRGEYLADICQKWLDKTAAALDEARSRLAEE